MLLRQYLGPLDLRKREQQALELNDNVLQGLVVAKMSLDLDDTTKGRLAELAHDESFLLAVEDYLRRTAIVH